MSDSTAWRNKPLSHRLAIAVPVAIAFVLVVFVIRNPDFLHRFTGPEFAVGDCVHVEQRLTDSAMSETDCTSNDTSNIGNPVYRVDQVLDGKDASCPGNGPGGVTFSNEPEDTTYCLSLARF